MIGLFSQATRPIGILVTLMVWWPLVHVVGQSADQPASTTQSHGSPADSRSVLSDPESNDDELRDAARLLIASAADDSDQEAALIALVLAPPSPRTGHMLLEEFALSGSPSAEVNQALGQLLDPAHRDTARLALRALARAHTPDAVVIVVTLLDEDSGAPPALRLEAITALKRQTGITRFGNDPGAWRTWWQTAQFLPQAEWHRQLAVAQGGRADALEQELRRRTDEVVELHRQLHLLTAEDDRQALLSILITSPTPELRALGLELTQRRLLNARPIGDPIVLALAALLAEPDPQVRIEAADLLTRLGRPEAMQHVLAALLQETDDSSAAALLTAASRHPQPALLLPALRWLEEGSVSRIAAIDTLLSLFNSGATLDAAQEERVRSVLLQMATGALPRSALALLVELHETQTVLGRLQSSDPQQVVWAADVLAIKGVAIDALVRAARVDRRVVLPALAAFERHQPTAERFTQALDLADLNDPDHSSALVNLARAIAPRALLALSRSQTDLKTRKIILAPAGDAAFFAVRTDCTARVELAIALAQTRLGLKAPGEALTGLGYLPIEWRGPRVQVLEIDSLIRLGRTDEAAAATTAAAGGLGLAKPFVEPWLANIEASDELGAASLAIKLRLALGELLDERDQARIDTLAGPSDDDPASAQEPAGDGDNNAPQ